MFPPVVILGKNDKFELVNTVADHDAFLTVRAGVFEGGELNRKKVAKTDEFTTREAVAQEFTVVEYKSRSMERRQPGTPIP